MTIRTTHLLLLAVALMGAGALPGSALAQAPSTNAPSQDQPRQFSVEPGTIVLEAQEFMTAGKFERALNKLSEALSLEALTPYEQSMIFQMQGSCFYEIDQYTDSITAFENAVDAGGLSASERRALEFNIAQLLIANEQFEKGAVMLERWHANGGTFIQKHLEMLWQAWSQAGRYDKALPWAEKWFENAGANRTRQHFDTLNFLYNTLNLPNKQIGVVEMMLEKWPEDKTLWDSLASLLANNGREADAFELKLRQYDAGLLTEEAELLQLIQYHSFYGIPFQGGQLMAHEIATGRVAKTADHYNQLADLWRQAREYERAIPALEKAVELAGPRDEASFSKLAEAYYHQGQCHRAQLAIGKIKPLGSRNLASLYTQLGVCFYEQSQDQPKPNCGDENLSSSERLRLQKLALEAFATSTDHSQGVDKTVHKTALSWTNFIKGEQNSGQEMCEFVQLVERDHCFQHIDAAYKARVLVGDLIIDDECLKYRVEFDLMYRPKAK